jgi:hypothetical protein
MAITRDELEDLVKHGLVSDIFKMERAYYLLIAIGEHASTVNDPQYGNFGELFGTFQEALQTEAVLAAARLYDRTSSKYPTRCILGVLDFLEKNRDQLPPIREIYNLELALRALDFRNKDIELASTNEPEFALALVNHFRAIANDSKTLNVGNALKTLRDKNIAHNERASGISGPTWGGLRQLIDNAKSLVGVLGWAYFSTAYVINGEYLLTSDAQSPSRALGRLVSRLSNQGTKKPGT